MRTLQLLIALFIFTTCNNASKGKLIQKLPDNSRFVDLNLADSLGNVTFSVPIRYDTMFSWTHTSDCGKPCEKIKYRFQPNSLPIYKESGFFYNELKDSIEQFTIVHSGYFPFRNDIDTNYIRAYHKHKIKDLLADPSTYKIQSDTIEKINNRYFSIVIIDLYNSAMAMYSRKVLASTTIKGNGIMFQYDLLTKKRDSASQNFINNSMQLLRTIKLSNGI